ncbi:POTRA domain-containing protein [Tenacibaculum sp. M341]|uniref:POTRA domain-containing protein n=1 Tax=Tenacibaculum sp. M341 TaxID=2530339 RepID=UPI001049852F|nr:POTRA domain-containing protein [Tenacibaculum sp. M341]TCI92546.1 hypothetical protein EYW44_06505 [Tenacibaculum sp. M341]
MNKYLFTFLTSYYILSSSLVFSQEISLTLKTKDSTDSKILPSIKYIKKHTNIKKLNLHLDSLSKQLKREGYFYNQIDSLKKNKEGFDAFLTLGQKIDSIKLSIPINTQNTLQTQQKEKTIHISNLEKFIDNINFNLEKKGSPFSKLSLEDIQKKDKQITVTLRIKESRKRKINNIIIKGYEKFPKKFLKHFLKINNSTLYNKDKVNKISEALNGIEFIKQIKKPDILFSKDSTILYLYLRKIRSNNFDGILNLTPSDNGDLNFSGNINLKLNNILNSGETFHLTWNANGNERQNINVLLKIPFIFNSPLSTETSLNIYNEENSFSNSKFKNSLTYKLSPKIDIGASLESETSVNLLSNNAETIENFNTTLFGGQLTYLTLIEHEIFKKKLFLKTSYLFGDRQQTNSKKVNQNKLFIEASYLYQINNRNFLFLRNESALINSSSFLNNELYRIGGPNSLRGFDQQSIFTSKYSYLNGEYRFLTSSKSYLYSIFDIGIIDNPFSIQQNAIGYGIGYFFKKNNSSFNISLASSNSNLNKTNILNLSVSYINFF